MVNQNEVGGKMEKCVFVEQVKEHFHYLIDDYGFAVVSERFDPEAFGNSLVDFQSGNTAVRILLNRGQVTIDIGPYPRSPGYQFDLSSIIEFLVPDAKEPVYIFPETWDNYQDMMNWQVDRLASVVQRYCARVLRGEFSEWEEIAEVRSRKATSEYQALTGKSPVRIASEELGRAIREEEKRAIKSAVVRKVRNHLE
jgi:hypothetical protein